MRNPKPGRRRGTVVAALALLACTTSSMGGPAHAAPGGTGTDAAYVRVNQVGYPAAASKRAYLMSQVVQTGATFAVKNAANTTVFTAPIGADLGAWSSTFSHVYALDFNAVATAGTYRVVVTGPAPATSPRSASAPA
jgi:hypothetical protein